MPLYKTEGIVLKQRDFLEADKLITLYSRNLGKIKIIAKGIKRPGSKLGGRLELFTYCSLLLAKGRNLDIVSDVEIKSSHLKLREDLVKLSYGLYIIELVEKGVEERSKSFNLFNLLALSLSSLEDVDYSSLEALTRIFEAGIISFSGYKPTLERCVECGQRAEVVHSPQSIVHRGQESEKCQSVKVSKCQSVNQKTEERREERVKFSVEKGGVLCRRCGEKDRDSLDISPKTLEVMKHLFLADNHCNLLKNHRNLSRNHCNRPLKKLLRLYLSYHLNLNMKSQDLPLLGD